MFSGCGFTYNSLNALIFDTLRENGFALFNGKVNTSEKECYEVASSEVDWDMHTEITKYGKDIDNLWPDLSKSRSENYFEEDFTDF